MPDVFVGQDLLTLNFRTKVDLSAATDVRVKFVKPTGETGEWTPADGVTHEGDVISYEVKATDVNVDGEWAFQGIVTLGGLVGYTKVVYQEFKKPL